MTTRKPLRLLACGHGRMGTAVEMAAKIRGHEITGFVSRSGRDDWRTVHAALEAEPADAVLDFSSPELIDQIVASCLFAKAPLVTGTTGWHERLGFITRLVQSKGGALLHAANFSVGVHLYLRTAEHAARLFSSLEGYDVAVEERHHRGKADAPSGTALELARRVLAAWPAKKVAVEGNPGRRLAPDELHVSSLRSGAEPGTHELVIDGDDDVITLRHGARGRRGFAMGAVQAAEWLVGRVGVFTLDDVIDDVLEQASAR